MTDKMVRSSSPSRKASLTKRKKGNLWNLYDNISNIGNGITGYVLRVKERKTGVRVLFLIFFFYKFCASKNYFSPITDSVCIFLIKFCFFQVEIQI